MAAIVAWAAVPVVAGRRSAAVVVPVIPAVPPIVTAVITPFVTLPVAGRKFAPIPVVANEIDPLTASIVRVAIPAPMFGMVGGHPEIDRLALVKHALGDPWFVVDHRWRRVTADVDAAKEVWIADANRHIDIGREGRAGNAGSEPNHGGSDQKAFHVFTPVLMELV
jgi:hypothetical protein